MKIESKLGPNGPKTVTDFTDFGWHSLFLWPGTARAHAVAPGQRKRERREKRPILTPKLVTDFTYYNNKVKWQQDPATR